MFFQLLGTTRVFSLSEALQSHENTSLHMTYPYQMRAFLQLCSFSLFLNLHKSPKAADIGS